MYIGCFESLVHSSSFEHFGASFSPITAVSRNILIAVGQSAGFVIPPASSVPPNWNNSASWLFISYDAGATFKPFRELSSSYQRGYYAVSGLPAAPVPGTIILQRFTNSGGQMVRSTNWGRTWQVVLNNSVSQVEFISRSFGFAIVQRGTTLTDSSLVQSGDAGGRWREVSIGVGR